jgi:hypothetical protein
MEQLGHLDCSCCHSRNYLGVIPAKAGTHSANSTASAEDK